MTAPARPTNRFALPDSRPRSGGADRYRTAVFLALVAATIYLVVVIIAVATSPYDTWGGFVVAPVLFILAFPLLRRMLNKVEPDSWIRTVVMLGFGAKLLGAYARFYTNEFILGRGDAIIYHQHGSAVSAEFRQFIFGGAAYQNSIPDLIGTQFIRLLLAGVYTLTGTTRIGGFVAFSFMSFWGLYLFYRAYSIAMPDGLRRRYAFLLFFLPSMVFWPSSVGKEAWMTTMLGLGTYGLARLLTQKRFAYLAIAAAAAGLTLVRPHVAVIYAAAMGAAFVLRRSKGGGNKAKKVLGLAFLSIMTIVLLIQVQSFFGLEEGLDAQEVFDKTASRSSQGGSRFETTQPTSVTGLPWAVVTVLFRPFLFEAGTPAAAFTAIEGTILLGLFLANAPRLIRLPGIMFIRPFIGYVAIYTLVFVFAFSAVSNFGILARQRTQLFPIAIVVVCMPIEAKMRTRKDLTARGPTRDIHQQISANAERQANIARVV